MNKILKTLATTAIVVTFLSGCSAAYTSSPSAETPPATSDVASSESTIETLRWADEIVLKKKVMSFNDHYEVSADGNSVGDIEGQYFYLLGDTFAFTNTDGNLVAYEGEKYKAFNHGAAMFDHSNEPVGTLDERLSFVTANWDILDAEDAKIGSAKQNFSFNLKFDVLNASDEVEYKIEKAFFTLGSELTITRIAKEPTVPVMNAVWLAAIANEIAEAEEAKKNSN